MLLGKVFININQKLKSIKFNNIQFNSKDCKPNDIFFAIKGKNINGNNYINNAILNGAKIIVSNLKFEGFDKNKILFIYNKNPRKLLSEVASLFFKLKPSNIIGVTGTNGKTSVVSLLHQLFSNLGYKCGLISTVENIIVDQKIKSTHTTPNPKQLNFLLREMVNKGCSYCFMEVSSHAVDQKRVFGLDFDVAVFTNITHDHLDYHENFANYLNAKKTFFDDLNNKSIALVNKDDKRSNFVLQNTEALKKTFSLKSFSDFKCKIIESDLEGMLLDIDGQSLWVKLIGKFNAYNLLATYSVANLLEQDVNAVLRNMSLLSPAEGRFETFRNDKNISFILDYAHTEDALLNVLSTINSIKKKNQRLITVFGCGGERDKLKRPLMTKVACDHSSQVILTSDNPRGEKIDDIISDMVFNLSKQNHSKTIVINDREQAIKTAFSIAQSFDIILVAGKGHEKFQEINGKKKPFDDKEKILELINQI